MTIFIHNSKLKKTYVIGENVYAPSDDGQMDVPEELAKKLSTVKASPIVEVTPEAPTKKK